MCEEHVGHHAHEPGHPHNHPTSIDRRALIRLGFMGLGGILLASCREPGSTAASSTSGSTAASSSTSSTTASSSTTTSSSSGVSADTLAGFDAFADSVKVFRDADTWMIESNGMPSHNMMVGIKSWQQQFPLPQPYQGSNAWQLPAAPLMAKTPLSARTALYRGAIAIAVNGVPIFNALNNRGDDAYLVGELDEWGGHCGRADDYHYHIAPLHLQKGNGNAPIAYALDGYPIYGAQEPDGSAMRPLDEWNGHADNAGGYHYHGTSSYPYINGGLVGVVRVADDQIDPQPMTTPFRPPGEPLRGAEITAFRTLASNRYELDYTLDSQTLKVAYEINGSSVTFTFVDATGASRTESYKR